MRACFIAFCLLVPGVVALPLPSRGNVHHDTAAETAFLAKEAIAREASMQEFILTADLKDARSLLGQKEQQLLDARAKFAEINNTWAAIEEKKAQLLQNSTDELDYAIKHAEKKVNRTLVASLKELAESEVARRKTGKRIQLEALARAEAETNQAAREQEKAEQARMTAASVEAEADKKADEVAGMTEISEEKHRVLEELRTKLVAAKELNDDNAVAELDATRISIKKEWKTSIRVKDELEKSVSALLAEANLHTQAAEIAMEKADAFLQQAADRRITAEAGERVKLAANAKLEVYEKMSTEEDAKIEAEITDGLNAKTMSKFHKKQVAVEEGNAYQASLLKSEARRNITHLNVELDEATRHVESIEGELQNAITSKKVAEAHVQEAREVKKAEAKVAAEKKERERKMMEQNQERIKKERADAHEAAVARQLQKEVEAARGAATAAAKKKVLDEVVGARMRATTMAKEQEAEKANELVVGESPKPGMVSLLQRVKTKEEDPAKAKSVQDTFQDLANGLKTEWAKVEKGAQDAARNLALEAKAIKDVWSEPSESDLASYLSPERAKAVEATRVEYHEAAQKKKDELKPVN